MVGSFFVQIRLHSLPVHALFISNKYDTIKDHNHGPETLPAGATPNPRDAASVVFERLCVQGQFGAIDACVDTLDLQELGIEHAKANNGIGQPAFDPARLLKLYLYGYQEGVQSSRRLEGETQRTMEVMWLCQGAKPSYKTIADFRKNTMTALQAANREFVLVCRELALLGGSRVAIDGTYLQADANRNRFHAKATLERDLKRL